MESLRVISSLAIPIKKISYNKKSNVFSVKILDFMFVGNYKKSIRISRILDDIYASLTDVQLNREDLYFLDFNNNKIHGNSKLKNVLIKATKKLEKHKDKPAKARKGKKEAPKILEKRKEDKFENGEEEILLEDDLKDFSSESEDIGIFEKEVSDELISRGVEDRAEEAPKMKDERKKKQKSSSAPPAPGGGGPVSIPTPPPSVRSPAPESPPPPPHEDVLAGSGLPPPKAPAPVTSTPEEPQPTVYEINMGLQYYSVMMEQRSYLFYVYFSHEELKIVDEEGKVIYETTLRIVTTKKEPPVLDLRIEGEGFEVHPLFGKVEVKKDAVNPPVMIFSILPLKSTKKKKKKKKKETERRFLNAYIDFEGKTISHTILSIIVQPKFFRLDIGPIHLNLSKKTATIISFISILIAGISLVYMLFSLDPSSGFIDILSGLAPGLGSIIFITIFLFTLLNEGIYPLKEKINAFLNFDQTGVLIK